MKELPLFDAHVPIACTIDDSDKPGRKDMLGQMRDSITAVERTHAGVVLSFLAKAKGLFEEFMVVEKQCCGFYGFAIDGHALRWEAPPEASKLMDEVYRFFSDNTITVEGLPASIT